MHRDHPRRHPDHGGHVDHRHPGHCPSGRLHARSRAAVPADRGGLRSRATGDGAARPSRAGRVADRWAAGRRSSGSRCCSTGSRSCLATSTSTRRSEWTDRPEFSHRRERHGLVGPFSGRQLALAFTAVLVAVIVLVGVTTPLGNTADRPGTVDPRATAYLIASPPVVGLKVGQMAPEFAVTTADGTTVQLKDLDGNPIRLADLRGKAVWVNFFTTWCPPCQAEVADPARRLRALPRSRARARRGLDPGDVAGRCRGLRRSVPARVHHRLRWRRRHLPGVQGVRPADPAVHRRERGHRLDRRRAARRDRERWLRSSGSCRHAATPKPESGSDQTRRVAPVPRDLRRS